MPKGSRCWKYNNEDLEELFGVGRNAIRSWERDKRDPFVRGSLKEVVVKYLERRFGKEIVQHLK